MTEFTEEETSWGETRFSAVQGKEMTCRLVEEGDGSDIEGLLAYGQWEGVLLYPTENHIAAGSQVEVTKRGAGDVAVELTAVGDKNTVTVQTENKIRSALGGGGYQITKNDGSQSEGSALLPSAVFYY